MKTMSISGERRTEFGKTKVKHYRSQELVPCSLYNEGTAHHFTLPVKEALKAIYTPDTYLLHISVDGVTYKAIIESTQFHPVFDYLQHIEFKQVHDDKVIQVELPVVLTGTAAGALAGGKLVQKMRRMRVRGKANSLPENIEIDISHLRLGRSLKVRELTFEGFIIAMAPDVPVATVEITRQLRQEAARQGR